MTNSYFIDKLIKIIFIYLQISVNLKNETTIFVINHIIATWQSSAGKEVEGNEITGRNKKLSMVIQMNTTIQNTKIKIHF